MGGQGRVIERTLYTDIVNGLKKLGFDAYSESKAGTGRDFPDVICIYNEKKIVIEVKFGNIEQNNPNIEELGQGKRYAEKLGTDDLMILVYPESLKNAVIQDTDWLSKQILEKPARGHFFITSVNWYDTLKEKPIKMFEILKNNISKKTSEVDQSFLVKQFRTIATDLATINSYVKNKDELTGEVVNKLKLFVGFTNFENEGKVKQELVTLSSFILFNQILFYRIYRKIGPKDNNLPELTNIEKLTDLQKIFSQIRKKGFDALYKSDILKHISDDQKVIETINYAIDSIKALQPEHIQGSDLIGMLFHEVIPFEIRKVVAAFYTEKNAAHILAGLTIDSFESSVFDPACGSGTLLTASYSIKEKIYYELVGFDDNDKLRKQFLESDITGSDIMPFAGHLTSLSLAIKDLEKKTSKLRVSTGDSLDLAWSFVDQNFKKHGSKIPKFQAFSQESLSDYMEKSKEPEKAKKIIQKVSGPRSISENMDFTIKPQDVVIMNPPFSDRAKIQKTSPELIEKLKKNSILNDIVGGDVNLWCYFIALGYLALKPGGKIGAVIPISIASGKATQKTRNLLLTEFSTRFIIKPPNVDKAFSRNAALKDILVIAEKRKMTDGDKTALVFFKSSVKEMKKGHYIEIIDELNSIIKSESVGKIIEKEEYDVRMIRTKDLIRYSLSLQPLLVSPFVEELENDVKEIAEIGGKILRKITKEDTKELYTYPKKPEGYTQLFAITSELDKSRTERAFLILKERKKNSLLVQIKNHDKTYEIPISDTEPFLRTLTGVKSFANCGVDFAIKKPPKEFNEIERLSKYDSKRSGKWDWTIHNKILRDNRSYVFLGSNFRPDSPNTHNFAFYTPEKICSPHTFKALMCETSEEGIFQTLLLNSSFGIAQMLLYRSQSRGGKTQIGQNEFMKFDIFDVSKLSKEQKTKLTNLYKKLKKIEFPPLMDQYVTLDKNKRTLDAGILDVLGMEKSKIIKFLDKMTRKFPDLFTVD